MNFIFLMDPLEGVIMEKDTSFALMLGAHRRGHKVFYAGDGGIVRKNNHIYFHAAEVVPQRISKTPFIIKREVVLSEKEINAVFVRNDPPFDEQYMLNMWLLDLLPKHIPVLNSPHGIRSVNEKIWASQFTSLVPPTFIGRGKDELKEFILHHKEVVAKPTNGHGGAGIFRIQHNDPNANVILETLTARWSKDIILQKYLKASSTGDKRILLLNGDILGAVLRVHAQGEHRNNFFAGGKPKPTRLTLRDNQIVKVLKPKLCALGLYFVGIDVIGDYLIEVNVTSPTCLQEMNQFYKARLEDKVIKFAEKLVEESKRKK